MTEIDRLQSFLRAGAADGREVVAVPPFTGFFHPTDELRFLNYAIPDGDVEPTLAEVEALRQAFSSRRRLPRLEWLEEFAPRVAGGLELAGMMQELRAPLMACAPEELVEPRLDVAAEVRPAAETDLRELANLQRVAFGQEPLASDARPSDPRRFGGGAVLARVDGEPVSAANWTSVIDSVSEIVGVATAESRRGRGLAGLLTAAAARAAFAAGAAVCVLSPGDETAQRVYARAGFRRVATVLHWADPE